MFNYRSIAFVSRVNVVVRSEKESVTGKRGKKSGVDSPRHRCVKPLETWQDWYYVANTYNYHVNQVFLVCTYMFAMSL